MEMKRWLVVDPAAWFLSTGDMPTVEIATYEEVSQA